MVSVIAVLLSLTVTVFLLGLDIWSLYAVSASEINAELGRSETQRLFDRDG